MRRVVGVAAIAALMLALVPATASAGAPSLGNVRPDLASELMLRLFGETTDATATFAAQNGDRSSESPFRELALQVRAAAGRQPSGGGSNASAANEQHIAITNLSGLGASYLAQAVGAGLLSTDVRFASPTQSQEPRLEALDAGNALFTAAYEPVAPEANVSPAPGTLAFDGTPAQAAPPALHTGSFGGDSEGRPAEPTLRFNVSGAYQRALPNDAALTGVPTEPSPWQLSGASVPLAVPDYAGSDMLSLRAGLAVPVFHGLTLNLNYDAQRSYGGNVLPGLENLDAANNSYAGRLTYEIPSSSSSFSISAYQNRFGDSVLPVNGYTQTGEDVNFTVKF